MSSFKTNQFKYFNSDVMDVILPQTHFDEASEKWFGLMELGNVGHLLQGLHHHGPGLNGALVFVVAIPLSQQFRFSAGSSCRIRPYTIQSKKTS
jgi:hypothetical protein